MACWSVLWKSERWVLPTKIVLSSGCMYYEQRLKKIVQKWQILDSYFFEKNAFYDFVYLELGIPSINYVAIEITLHYLKWMLYKSIRSMFRQVYHKQTKKRMQNRFLTSSTSSTASQGEAQGPVYQTTRNNNALYSLYLFIATQCVSVLVHPAHTNSPFQCLTKGSITI